MASATYRNQKQPIEKILWYLRNILGLLKTGSCIIISEYLHVRSHNWKALRNICIYQAKQKKPPKPGMNPTKMCVDGRMIGEIIICNIFFTKNKTKQKNGKLTLDYLYPLTPVVWNQKKVSLYLKPSWHQ